MKKFLCVLLVAVMLVCCAACGSEEEHGGVIGTVNGQDIYQDEFDYYFAYYFEYYYQNYYSYYQQLMGVDMLDEESSKDLLADFESAAWEACVSAALIEQVGAEYGVTYEDNYLMDILPWGDYRTIKVGTINSQLYDAVRAAMLEEMTVDEAASRAAYDSNPADWDCRQTSHILIKCDVTDEAALAEAKVKAEGIIAQLNEGADFAELAQEYSDDSSAANGGKIDPYFNVYGNAVDGSTSLFAEYVAAAFQLQNVGDYTLVPVQSQAGYHIIKLDDVRIGYDQVKDFVDNSLKVVDEESLDNKVIDLLAEAHNKAEIVQKMQFRYYVPEDTSSANDAAGNEISDPVGGTAPVEDAAENAAKSVE